MRPYLTLQSRNVEPMHGTLGSDKMVRRLSMLRSWLYLLVSCVLVIGCGDDHGSDASGNDDGADSGSLDAADGGSSSPQCSGDFVASCLVGQSSCVDHYGAGYSVESIDMICRNAGGTLSTDMTCVASDWTGGCILDVPELERCKVSWQALDVETLRDACGDTFVPAPSE